MLIKKDKFRKDSDTAIPAKDISNVIKNRKKMNKNRVLFVICLIGFLTFSALFINDAFLQPWRAEQAVDYTRELYHEPSHTPSPTFLGANNSNNTTTNSRELKPTTTPISTPIRDEQGRRMIFHDLLNQNPDTKGWITYPGTNIDYVVMQSSDDSQFYLTHDFNKKKQKAGSLFLDSASSIEQNTKNLVIYGHNMKSTNNMFHSLEYIKKLDYFKTHTYFTFDTLYQKGQWKVFSVFITNGSDEKESFFDYTKATFKNSSEFLNFIYQLRIRSLFNLDQVDINENDQICTLSTCSYEINDYRLVIVGRKLREGETAALNAELIKKNTVVLYPQSFYDAYGGKAPKLPSTFDNALKKGIIRWYKSVG